MKNLFYNFINTLRHYKVSSLMNIMGMSVAFTAFYLIMTQVTWNFNFNKNLKDADRTYIVAISNDYSAEGFSTYFCRPIAEKIIATSKGIEVGGVINTMTWNMVNYLYQKTDSEIKKIPWAAGIEGTKGGFEAIGLKVLSGSIDKLEGRQSVGISESIAKQYHIELGDILLFDLTEDAMTGQVELIFADMPKNSSFSDISIIRNIGDYNEDSYSQWGYNYFLKLDKNAELDSIIANCKAVMKNHYENDEHLFSMVSLEDIFYSKDVKYGRTGNKTTDISLLVVAILTLLIALINFINFFFALVPVRIKSVNTYKVLGMSRTSLVFNFVLESVGMVLVSLFISAIMIHFVEGSSLASVLNSPCGFADNVETVVFTILVAVLSTAIGSIYPAMFITSFQPAMVLKGFSSATTGSNIKTILISLQFIVSIALILCSSFVKLQHKFMMNYDLGFDKEQLIYGGFFGESSSSKLSYFGPSNDIFENTLKSDSRIKDIAWAAGDIISVGRMGWGREYKGGNIAFQCYPVSWNFLNFMGIEIIRGRDFQKSDEQSDGGAIIFNEEADRRYGIDFDAPFNGHSETYCEIAGICKDFHFKPLQYGNDAFAFYVFGKEPWSERLPNIFIRTEAGANPFELIQFIKDKVAELDPTYDIDLLELNTFDKSLEQKYMEEKNLSVVMTLFTLIAIIISLMGVFGIVLFDTQHRCKEIAIRRVIGADVRDILKMLNRKYIFIVLICFAIATPISYLIINRYLDSFANRISIHWWVYALTLLVVLFITIMVVTIRSIKVATSNPVDNIKDE